MKSRFCCILYFASSACGGRNISNLGCEFVANGGAGGTSASQTGKDGGNGGDAGVPPAIKRSQYFIVRTQSRDNTVEFHRLTWNVDTTLSTELLSSQSGSCAECDFAYLSPDGRHAITQYNTSDGKLSTLKIFDFDSDQVTDGFDLGLSKKLSSLNLQWVDSTRAFIEYGWADNPSRRDEVFLRVGNQDRISPQLGEVRSRNVELSAFTVSPTGPFAIGQIQTAADKLEVGSFEIGDSSIGAKGIGHTVSGRQSEAATWSKDGSAAVVRWVNSMGTSQYEAFYDIGLDTLGETSFEMSSNHGQLEFSAANKLVLWPEHCSTESLPIVTVRSALQRDIVLPDEDEWCPNATSPDDQYLVITSKSKLALARLHNAYADEIATVIANLAIDHAESNRVVRPLFVSNGREVVYELYDESIGWRGVFLIDIDAPRDSLVRLSDALGGDPALGKFVAPQGDFIAIPSSKHLYLVRLERPNRVDVILDFGQVEPFLETSQFAWAPDGSGFIVVSSGERTKAYFVPREANGNKSFGSPRTVELTSYPTIANRTLLPRVWGPH